MPDETDTPEPPGTGGDSSLWRHAPVRRQREDRQDQCRRRDQELVPRLLDVRDHLARAAGRARRTEAVASAASSTRCTSCRCSRARSTCKCAKICGETSGNYHPHGEAVIYPTLVHMAQPWAMRERLVDGKGNFGSVEDDPPAAMRYTEARLTHLGAVLMEDMDKDTVDFVPNYDERLTEPTVFPAAFPNLLVNGGTGIAVGMATNMAPHNLGEVIDGICAQIDNPADHHRGA